MFNRPLEFQNIFPRMYPELINVTLDEPIVKNITFVVTQDCPLRCTYCYQHHKNQNHIMSKETAKKAVDTLFKQYKENSPYINETNARALILEFIGGEPLLEIDLIDYTVDYFRMKALTENHPWSIYHAISITTNGVLYFDDKVQRFMKKNKNRLSLGITIDGNKELHDSCRVFPNGQGSYDVVEKAYKAFLKENVGTSTKLTLAPENISYLYDAVLNLYDIGLTHILANCVFEKGWNVNHAKIFYNQLKKLADWYLSDEERYTNYSLTLFDNEIGVQLPENDNRNYCGGTGKMLAVDSGGMFYPCLRYLPFCLKEGCKPLVIGDIDNGIESTEQQHEIVCELKAITRRSQSTDECFYCPIGKGCAWCFKAGTKILTPIGFTSIENLKIGDEVITKDGTIESIYNTSSHLTNEQIALRVNGTPTIYTTKEHPFWSRKKIGVKQRNIYGEPQWINAEDLNIGDQVGLFVPEPGYLHIDKNIAYIVGYWLGNGWKSEHKRKVGNSSTEYFVCCNNKKAEILENKLKLAKISYCKDTTIRTAQQYKIYTKNHNVDDNNELLISILSDCGKYAHGKKVSTEIFSWDKKSIKALLKGYFHADGYIYKDKRKLISVSKELLLGVSMLLRMLKNNPAWSIRKNNTNIIQGRKVNCKTSYDISYKNFNEYTKHFFEYDEENNIMWGNVTFIDTDIDPYVVYNISVNNNPTYIADGAIVHNCSAYNYEETGTPNKRMTYICIMHKARCLANAYYWNKFYKLIGEKKKKFPMNVPKEWALEIIDENEYEMLKELSE